MKFQCSKSQCHEVQVIDWSKSTDGGPIPYENVEGKPCPICLAPLISAIDSQNEVAREEGRKP